MPYGTNTSTTICCGLVAFEFTIGTSDLAATTYQSNSGLNATSNAQAVLDQQSQEKPSETNSSEVGGDDVYETDMISSDVTFVTKFSESQMSLIISQDASSNGILSMLEDDLVIPNSTQQNQSLNEQTIRVSVDSRNY